jgi:hypothetical protein
VKMCRSKTCGDGDVDEEAWEQCDSWKDKKWNKVDCTEMCTIKDPNNPKCWNGKIDEWETCKNCEEDVWKCTARCGNGIVEDAEDCRNCPKDVKECSAVCWNGEVEEWEDCENCKKDVKICIKKTCW